LSNKTGDYSCGPWPCPPDREFPFRAQHPDNLKRFFSKKLFDYYYSLRVAGSEQIDGRSTPAFAAVVEALRSHVKLR
jgi:hypothetical protein